MESTRGTPLKVYERVAEDLKTMIASGELSPGTPLPAERQLIDRFSISRTTLRQAYRILENVGLIECLPGKGRFVRKSRIDRTSSGGVPLQDESILELVEARMIFEPAIAAEAAKHASPSDLTKIRRILTKTSKDVESLAHRAECDYDFHLLMAEATHNFIFVNIMKMMFNLVMVTHERIYGLLADKEIFLREHDAIYNAVLGRDIRKASKLMTDHVWRVYRTLQDGIALEGIRSSDMTAEAPREQ
jgi:GntR family transcriptional repressor for pyruvate dehydrogenase complex